MPQLVADCPLCGSRLVTFDVLGFNPIRQFYDWQWRNEVFCVCRYCHCSTIFILHDNVGANYDYLHKIGLMKLDGVLNDYQEIERYISIKDQSTVPPPEHLPDEIKAIFEEGATCLAVNCYNAAGTMFRLCVDVATRALLPKADSDGLPAKVRRDLGLRLPWLFANNLLPESLLKLSTCIKEDGNDGAHSGTLEQVDAEDLLDFTTALLERMYTEPERLRSAEERRNERRKK